MEENLPAINLDEIEQRLLAEVQAICPLKHIFGPGLYIRELRMGAGTLAMGHRQRLPHLNIFIQGKVLMLREDGEKVILEAPLTFIGQPGRKIGYVLEDVIWQNIYATEETDIDILEDTYLDKSEYSSTHQSEPADHTADHSDYLTLIEESGIPQEQITTEIMNTEDQIPMPPGFEKVCVRGSKLHGKGLIATSPFLAGEIIAPARIGNKRTPAGRFTNHSSNPNSEFIPINNDVVLVALRPISGCRGGDSGEEITVDYRQALRMRGIVFKGDL